MNEAEEFIAAIGAMNKRLMEAEMAYEKRFEQLVQKNKPANAVATVINFGQELLDEEDKERSTFKELIAWRAAYEEAIIERQTQKLKPESILVSCDWISFDGKVEQVFVVSSNKHYFGVIESGKMKGKHFIYDPFIGKLVELKDKRVIKVIDTLNANRKKIKKIMFGTETPLEDGCDEPKVELHEAVLQVLKEHNLKFPE